MCQAHHHKSGALFLTRSLIFQMVDDARFCRINFAPSIIRMFNVISLFSMAAAGEFQPVRDDTTGFFKLLN